jgi:hypothetical protein
MLYAFEQRMLGRVRARLRKVVQKARRIHVSEERRSEPVPAAEPRVDHQRVDQGLMDALLEAAHTDTAYRDLYLHRARKALVQVMPRAEHDRLRRVHTTIDGELTRIRDAIAASDWLRVLEGATRVSGLRRLIDSRRGEWELAEAVYALPRIAVDPFSAELVSHAATNGSDPSQLRNRLLQALTHLEEADGQWRAFYTDRRLCFSNLALQHPGQNGSSNRRGNLAEVQREALRAAERGDVERVRGLAEAVLQSASVGVPVPLSSVPAGPTSPRASGVNGKLPPGTVERARGLGLTGIRLKPYGRIGAYVRAAANGFGGAGGQQPRAGTPAPLRELVRQFMSHRYITSAGTRYLPKFAEEDVLVEYFPETPEPPADARLLVELGLSRRRGLSRLEIEAALLENGPRLIEDSLELDPRQYRLICIPFDVYVRLGLDCGWGRQAYWTHFDGYQLLRTGRPLALVGGDRRYGGVYDLCGIDASDARERVMARFAVVHRTRFSSDTA